MNKKHIIIFLLIGILFISCSKEISTEPIERDCEYLKKLLPEASIDFSMAVDNGLDIDSFINDVKKKYVDFAEQNYKNKFEEPDENGIYNEAFVSAITYSLQNALHRKNTHMTIKGKNASLAHAYKKRVYVSDIYFEKTDEDFFVIKSFLNDISKGMKYTGEKKNIVQEYSNGNLAYQYIVFSENFSLETAEINLDGNNISIPVKRIELKSREGKDLWYEKNKSILYITTKTFKPSLEKNIEEYEATRSEICETINSFNNVVFDFRDNGGGNKEYFFPILANMIFGEIDYYDDERVEQLYDDIYLGEKYLVSETVKNSFLLNGDDFLPYFINKGERYFVFQNKNEKTNIKTPVYKGKIFVVMNNNTASAAEHIIGLLKKYFANQVILLGEKSRGTADFGCIFGYLLPDSKIRLFLCAADYSDSAIMNRQFGWNGDTEGFYPDFWIFSEDDINEFIKLYSF